MDMIYGKEPSKPERRFPPRCLMTQEETIVTIAKLVLPPDAEPVDWFAGYDDAKSAVHIKDGKYREDLSETSIVGSGEISDTEIKDLCVVSYDGRNGAIYAEGAGSNVTVDGATVYLEGTGKGIGGPGTCVAVRDHANMVLKNAFIDTTGKSRFGTVAEKYSTLRVYDSVIWAHGIPFGEGYEPVEGLMASPPAFLEIEGNSRAHCTMTNSYTYFYNTKIITDGWAALSTETASGFVYLEANDCDVIVTKSGYGAYADPGCHDIFNRCNFNIVGGMATILAGQGEVTYNDCDIKCGTYFTLVHSVMGDPRETGVLNINGSKIKCKKDAVYVKSQNVIVDFKDSEIDVESGVIVKTVLNDDPCATTPDEQAYGVNVNFTDMQVNGDVIHEDPDREMWLKLENTSFKGAIMNANLKMDIGSHWYATKNSTVTFVNDIVPDQIDAPKDVVIQAKGKTACVYELSSGGKIVVEE